MLKIFFVVILFSLVSILKAQNQIIDSLNNEKNKLLNENSYFTDSLIKLSKYVYHKKSFPLSDDSLKNVIITRKKIYINRNTNEAIIKKIEKEIKKEEASLFNKTVTNYFKIEPQYILLNEFSIFNEHVLTRRQSIEMSLGVNYSIPEGPYPSPRLFLCYISGVSRESIYYKGITTRLTYRYFDDFVYANFGLCLKYNYVNKGPVLIDADSNFHQKFQTRTDKLLIPGLIMELGAKLPPYKNNINLYIRLSNNYKFGTSIAYNEYWEDYAPVPPSRTDYPYKTNVSEGYLSFKIGCKITLVKIKKKE